MINDKRVISNVKNISSNYIEMENLKNNIYDISNVKNNQFANYIMTSRKSILGRNNKN